MIHLIGQVTFPWELSLMRAVLMLLQYQLFQSLKLNSSQVPLLTTTLLAESTGCMNAYILREPRRSHRHELGT